MLILENHILDHLQDRLHVRPRETVQTHQHLLKMKDHLDLVQNLLTEKVILDHLLNLRRQKLMEKLFKVNRHIQYVRQNLCQDQGVLLWKNLGKVLI